MLMSIYQNLSQITFFCLISWYAMFRTLAHLLIPEHAVLYHALTIWSSYPSSRNTHLSACQKLSHLPGPSSYDMCHEKPSLNFPLLIKLFCAAGARHLKLPLYSSKRLLTKLSHALGVCLWAPWGPTYPSGSWDVLWESPEGIDWTLFWFEHIEHSRRNGLWLHQGPSCLTQKTEKRKHLTVEAFLFLLEKMIEWDGRGEDGVSREVFKNPSVHYIMVAFIDQVNIHQVPTTSRRLWKALEIHWGTR